MQKNTYAPLIAKLKQTKLHLESELGQFADPNPDQAGDFNARQELLGPSQEDESTERELRESAIGTEHSLEDRLEAVWGALKRVKDGTYGLCQHCDQKIPIKRLNIVPEAQTCQSCQPAT